MFFQRLHSAFSQTITGHSADIYHASDLYVLPALTQKAQELNARLVFDSRELYAHVAATINKPLSRLFWDRLQAFLLPKTDLIFTVSNSISTYLANRYGIQPPIVVPNVPRRSSPELFHNLKTAAGIQDDRFVALHLGNARPKRGCDLLVRAVGLADTRVHAVFLGLDQSNGELHRLASDVGATDRVHFLPPVAPDSVLDWACSADIGLTLLEPSCLNHQFALPNKLFEYISAGIPVIGRNLSEIATIIRSYNVGAVTSGNPVDLARKMEEALSHPETVDRWKRNTRSVVTDFNWKSASDSFIEAYSTVLETE